MLRAVWPIAVRNMGENHFGTVAGKAYLARILARQKKYLEAEDMLMGVIERQKHATAARDDGEHPDQYLAMYFLLEWYQVHGRIDDAIRVADELFEGLSRIGGQGLGLLHPFANKLLATRADLQAAKNTFGADRSRILQGIQPIFPSQFVANTVHQTKTGGTYVSALRRNRFADIESMLTNNDTLMGKGFLNRRSLDDIRCVENDVHPGGLMLFDVFTLFDKISA